MTIAKQFLHSLQRATDTKEFPKLSEPVLPEKTGQLTFQMVLDEYAKYYNSLKSTAKKEKLSRIFWQQIKALGTPIIEDIPGNDSECSVYFLYPKENLERRAKRGGKKDLYLQGDFHGYGSVDGRQQLLELEKTGIMTRRDSIPKKSILTYSYIQVAHSHRGEKPEHQLVPFFKDSKENTLLDTIDNPAIPSSVYTDTYSTHASPYPGFYHPEKIFRVSSDPKDAHIAVKPIDWPTLLNTRTGITKSFGYYDTFYSSKDGTLHQSQAAVTKEYNDDLYYSDQRPNSPYAHFTRAINVFKPHSNQIDNTIVINDGIPYLITGILDHLEKMIEEGKLSPNTALVFINTMPGLKTTLSKDKGTAQAFENDPRVKMGGMGVRLIDYEYGIDEYTDFIENKLFPQLNEKGINSIHRVMIGSSLSGTAGIYIGLKRPELFGGIIAQSPSPSNREILRNAVTAGTTQPKTEIHLSCGIFEKPGRADNTNLPYAIELSKKLQIPLYEGTYGHQFLGWNEELEQSLPDAMWWATLRNPVIVEQESGKCNLTFYYRGNQETEQVELISSICDPYMQSCGQFEKNENTNIWSLTVKDVPKDARISYLLAVNKEPAVDLHNSFKIDQYGYTGEQYIVEMPDASPQPYVHRSELATKMETIEKEHRLQPRKIEFDQSETLKDVDSYKGKIRNYWIHIPPDISMDNDSCELLLHLDGDETINRMKMPAIMDIGMQEKRIRPTVTIYLDSAHREIEYGCGKEAELFADYLAQEFIPEIHATFPNISKEPKHTTIAGYSMGGHAAAQIGTRHPEVFGNVIGQSSSFWMGGPTSKGYVETEGLLEKLTEQKYPQNPEAQQQCFYLNVGTLETAAYALTETGELVAESGTIHAEANQHFHQFLEKNEIQHQFDQYSGDHCYAEWQNNLIDGLKSIYQMHLDKEKVHNQLYDGTPEDIARNKEQTQQMRSDLSHIKTNGLSTIQSNRTTQAASASQDLIETVSNISKPHDGTEATKNSEQELRPGFK